MAKNWWEMGTAELQNDPEALRASYGFQPSAEAGGGMPTKPTSAPPDQPSYGPAYGPGTDPSGGGGGAYGPDRMAPGMPGPGAIKPPNQPNPLADVAMTPEMDYPGHISPEFGGTPDPEGAARYFGGIKGLWGGIGKGGGAGPGEATTGWWDWTKEGIPDKGGILPVGQFPEGPAGDPYRENAPPGWGQPQPGLENRPEGETGGAWLDAAAMPRGGQRPVPPTTGSGAAIPFPAVGGGRDFIPGPPDPNWMHRAESGDNYPGFGGGAIGPAINPFGRGYQPMGGPGTGGTPGLPNAGLFGPAERRAREVQRAQPGPYGGIGQLLRPEGPATAATKNWWEMSPEELRANPAALRASYGYGG